MKKLVVLLVMVAYAFVACTNHSDEKKAVQNEALPNEALPKNDVPKNDEKEALHPAVRVCHNHKKEETTCNQEALSEKEFPVRSNNLVLIKESLTIKVNKEKESATFGLKYNFYLYTLDATSESHQVIPRLVIAWKCSTLEKGRKDHRSCYRDFWKKARPQNTH